MENISNCASGRRWSSLLSSYESLYSLYYSACCIKKDHSFLNGLGFPHKQLLLLKDLLGYAVRTLQYLNKVGSCCIHIPEAIRFNSSSSQLLDLSSCNIINIYFYIVVFLRLNLQSEIGLTRYRVNCNGKL